MISGEYRKDIDGLRAIAVIAVILFHFGYLPMGYLGVDVFFVISGFLITGIISRELAESTFSIRQFYLRRVRRIIPLVLFINLVCLTIGLMVMLPDDLENLAESVVATNLFSNNILQAITTKNYWDVVNEYKPLLHTWSLGVEEQFYLFYPFLLLLFRKWIRTAIIVLTAVSLLLFFLPFPPHHTFYFIQFRFFELSAGGIAALFLRPAAAPGKYRGVLIALLLLVLSGLMPLPEKAALCTTVLVTLSLLVAGNNSSKASKFLLQNPSMVFVGKISFSLYMWHQPILAFTRYLVTSHLTPAISVAIISVIVVLSVITYFAIEQPFRNKTRMPNARILWITGLAFLLSTGVGFYIYQSAGILYAVPELDVTPESRQHNQHAKYNDRIGEYDNFFTDNSKTNLLVIGNSFARDWANILLESKVAQRISISYVYDPLECADIDKRLHAADYVFFSEISRDWMNNFLALHPFDTSKVQVVGTKNFGKNNGIFFNYKGEDRYQQRTNIDAAILAANETGKKEWGHRYIDLIGLVINSDSTMPVFTPEGKFISQDCRHLTKRGAQYYAHLLNNRPGIVSELEHFSK